MGLHPCAHLARRLSHGRRSIPGPRRNGTRGRRPPSSPRPNPSHHPAEPVSRRRTEALTSLQSITSSQICQYFVSRLQYRYRLIKLSTWSPCQKRTEGASCCVSEVHL